MHGKMNGHMSQLKDLLHQQAEALKQKEREWEKSIKQHSTNEEATHANAPGLHFKEIEQTLERNLGLAHAPPVKSGNVLTELFHTSDSKNKSDAHGKSEGGGLGSRLGNLVFTHPAPAPAPSNSMSAFAAKEGAAAKEFVQREEKRAHDITHEAYEKVVTRVKVDWNKKAAK